MPQLVIKKMIKLPDIATQASGSMACPASSMNA